MSFVLMLIFAMFFADAAWWLWADRTLRPRTRWRIVLATFIALQIGCLMWIVLGRRLGGLRRIDLPAFVLATVYVWHFVGLPIAALSAAGESISRLIAAAWRRPAPGNETVPAERGVSRRQLLSAAIVAAPPVATVLVTGRSLSQLDEFRVRRFDVLLPQLPAALEGFKIAHVSDIHVGRFTGGNMLRKIADATNDLRADVVLFSGDLIDRALADVQAGIDTLRRMDAPHGLFMVEGNHDLFESRRGFEQAVKQAGVPLLVDETATLNIKGQDVQILGLRWSRGEVGIADSMRALLRQRQPSAFPILLAHHPHAFDPAAAARVPLTLSGHTHGGQLMASANVGFGPLIFKYWSGLYQQGDSRLVVSNGVGNWFPLRINAPAEIGEITLHCS